MPPNTAYKIEFQQPQTYLDSGGAPVSGFLVRATLTKWSEAAEIHVPKLDPLLIDNALKQLIANREKLDELGK